MKSIEMLRASLACCLLSACVDTSAVDFSPVTADAGNADTLGIDVDFDTPCRRCLLDPAGACAPEIESCSLIPKCPTLVDCLLDRNCFEPPELPDRITCGTPCFEATGVLAGTDPAISAVLEINACTLRESGCKAACFRQ